MRAKSLCVALCIAAASAAMVAANEKAAEPKVWKSSYAAAYEAAGQQGKMLLIFFSGPTPACEDFDRRVLAADAVQKQLDRFVCARLPLDARATIDGREATLLEQPSLAAMNQKSGLVIIDLANKGAAHYGCVVSVLPFSKTGYYSQREMLAVLALPPGTRAARDAELNRRLAKGGKPIAWLDDYAKATEQARRKQKMLLIRFYDGADDPLCREFEQRTWSDAEVRGRLPDYVCLRLPLEAEVTVDDKSQRLLEQPAFAEMLGRPGIAIVDHANTGTPHYGCVVSTFPLTLKLRYSPREVAAMLDLPPGTLTQRTLIFAVRTHPERPESAEGQLLARLTREAESHSQYQAAIRVQGHHRWETRFHQINADLPGGLRACEVCAESWPGERLVEAAIECVRCWRLSSGHWSAVRARHSFFGYDMKRGSNGIWYATGVFGSR